MKKHIESVHEKKKPHKCTECDKSFAFKNDVGKHIDGVHKKLKPFLCFYVQYDIWQTKILESMLKQCIKEKSNAPVYL